jgi:chemotaxis protein methyltransferase CheR
MANANHSWNALRSFMQDQCGVMLAEDQHYLMDARLSPVAKTLNYTSVDEYVLEACRPGAPRTVTSPLIDAMTTHETYFFRDTGFWKALGETILPKLGLLEPGSTKPLKVWIAACSTGQEPYTLSMLLQENFPSVYARTTIVATDVSDAVVEQAKKGVFTVFEVNRGISAPRLLRHFERDGGNFRIKAALKTNITWQTQNLITGWPPGEGFDLVLVRNVLIYFPDGHKQTVIKKARAALKAQGFIGIGATELIAGAALSPGWYPAR